MIDLNKAGAWSAVEQLEIAELLRNPTEAMEHAAYVETRYYDIPHSNPRQIFKAMIDAATGGEG